MEIKKHILPHFFSRACFLAFTFFVNIFYARLLGATGSGELNFTLNNYSILALIFSFSLESGITYFVSKNQLDEPEIQTFSLIWPMVAAGLAAFLLYLDPRLFKGSPTYDKPVFVFIFMTGTMLTSYFSALFFAKKQFQIPFLIPTLSNLLILLLCTILYLGKPDKPSISQLAELFFGIYLLNGILLTIFYKRRFGGGWKLVRTSAYTLKKITSYSGQAFIANLVAFFAYRVDYWILKGFSSKVVSSQAMGNYIQVNKMVQLFVFIPTVLATIVFPSAASMENPNFNKELRRVTWGAFLINLIGCIVLLITGRSLFPLLLGDGFTLMYPCFLYSIPAILAITVVRVLASYFAGINRVRYNLIGGLIALVLVVVGNYLLVPFMGINGAALADSAGFLAYMIFMVLQLRLLQ